MVENLDSKNIQATSLDNNQENQIVGSGNVFKDILLPSMIILAVILSGTGIGFLVHKKVGGSVKGDSIAAPGAQISDNGQEVGVNDTATFRDQAEGNLEAGGIDGEGTHHLVRPGGDSQNVYLTSSVVDLSQFVGKKVQVWGETIAAKKAGWLMDVGKVKVIE